MTQDQFDSTLATICDEDLHNADHWLKVPGVYKILAAYYQDDIAERWAREHPGPSMCAEGDHADCDHT